MPPNERVPGYSKIIKNKKMFKYTEGETIFTGKIIRHIVGGLVLLIVLFGSWSIVGAGERGKCYLSQIAALSCVVHNDRDLSGT